MYCSAVLEQKHLRYGNYWKKKVDGSYLESFNGSTVAQSLDQLKYYTVQ